MYAAISGLLLAIALAACAIPALRVARLNPATALRQD
jgi:ABC-type antimicrobial peptide transport system permease subunit